MRILAIDTALSACSAAVFDAAKGTMLALESLLMTRGHAEALMPMIARVMESAGIDFADLDRVAVTVGPGSFTGLRVGISAARGIALAARKPAVGLSTLSVFAAPIVAQTNEALIVAAIDAAHGNVYIQVFGRAGRTLVAPRIAPIAEAVQAAMAGAPKKDGRAAYLVGPAAELVAAAWPANAAPPALFDAPVAPDIEWVARLGAVAPASDTKPKPLYLRAPDAKPQERARLARR